MTAFQQILPSLYRISQAATSALTGREACQIAMEEILATLSPTAASISLINPDNGMLEKELAHGYPQNIDELALHLGKGVSGRVAFHGESILIPDVSQDSRYIALISSTRSMMAVPMISDGQIIGVIDADSDRLGAFEQLHLEKLELIAIEATRALQNVWQHRQLENQSSQLNALIEVGKKIVSNLELQNLWDSITEAALELTGARLCALQIFEKSEGKVSLRSVRPAWPEYEQASKSVDIELSLASSALRTQRQVEFANTTTPDYYDLVDVPRHPEVISCLSTPIAFEGEIIGVINIYTQRRHRFANAERRLLQAFASLSAAAAKNADLYERVVDSEERLRKSERLTTLGLLSAEIAHEIRNPLTVIKLLFGSLGLNYEESDPRHKDVRIVKERINHLEEIVSKVLSFGKAPDSLFSRWQVNDLIDDTCVLVRHKLSQQKITLDFRPLAQPTSVSGNKGQLQQVFLNLIINAAEAMPTGGSLAIEPKVETVSERRCVAIYISDTGSGIDPGIQDQIFDSFLTGKPEGTGLGLSIVKRILKSHHGDISVTLTSDSGTTMRVELPLA